MKITAGVILIIAAIFNLFASFGYMAGGAITSGGSQYAEKLMVEAAKNNLDNSINEDQPTDLNVIKNALDDGEAIGGGLMVYGIFLLISVGILIAGAVFLFKESNPGFIKIAGIISILAEVISIVIISFGVMNVLGIVGGVLALIAAKSIGIPIQEEPSETSA